MNCVWFKNKFVAINQYLKMKKFYYLLLTTLFIFSSCSKDDELTTADVTAAVNAALAAANIPTTDQITSAVTSAVNAAMASGTDIDQAIADALAAQASAPETVGIEGGVTIIETSATWTNDRIWIMNGKVVVRNGGVLNIEAGTIIKAGSGTGADASACIGAHCPRY